MTQTEASIPRSRKVLFARRSTLLASVVGLGFAVLAVGLGGYNPPNFQDWANPACAASGLASSVPALDAPLRRIPEFYSISKPRSWGRHILTHGRTRPEVD